MTEKLLELEYRLALHKSLAHSLYTNELYHQAMFHHLRYLDTLDEYNKTYLKATHAQIAKHREFGWRLAGIIV